MFKKLNLIFFTSILFFVLFPAMTRAALADGLPCAADSECTSAHCNIPGPCPPENAKCGMCVSGTTTSSGSFTGNWDEATCKAAVEKLGNTYTPDLYDANNKLCYAPKAPIVSLAYPFGDLVGKKEVSMADYIAAAYKYGFVLAIALAILMIIIGGLMWVLSGAVDMQKNAQEFIKQSLIGLVILACSYLLLNTVNPQLTNMELPQIPMVMPEELQKPTSCSGTGESGSFCSKNADCNTTKGYYCVALEGTVMTDIAAGVAIGAVTVMSFGVAAEAGLTAVAAKEAATGILRFGANAIWTVTKTAVMNPLKTAAVGYTAGKVYESYTAEVNTAGCKPEDLQGKSGVCMITANQSLPIGMNCGEDKNCAPPAKCVCQGGEKDENGKCSTYGSGLGGICSTGSNGNYCNKDNGDKDCAEGLKCLKGDLETWCSDGSKGSTCEEDQNCVKIKDGKCIDHKCQDPNGIGKTCSSNADCQAGYICIGGSINSCSDGNNNSPCSFNSDCLSNNCYFDGKTYRCQQCSSSTCDKVGKKCDLSFTSSTSGQCVNISPTKLPGEYLQACKEGNICDAGLKCVNNTCTNGSLQNPCNSDYDCSTNIICVNNKCCLFPGEKSVKCIMNSDCCEGTCNTKEGICQ